jgi:hypothetical protein
MTGTATFTRAEPSYEFYETGYVPGMGLGMVKVVASIVELELSNLTLAPLDPSANDGFANPARGSFVLNGSLRSTCFTTR